ncbi:GNAT family N-acetyltransferase [Rhizobium sp. PP-CC-3G-465]|uniref:GNAT family N-acetyltransferase n=1 Tax=Rhizobium sp. PP-CC-3G-465 TaxID=2135648 RepID=UPI001042EAC6
MRNATRLANHGDPPQIREGGGRKIGERLVGQAVDDARREGTVISLCPFSKARIEHHPEWQDVLRTSSTGREHHMHRLRLGQFIRFSLTRLYIASAATIRTEMMKMAPDMA